MTAHLLVPGELAPDFTLADLQGNTVSLSDSCRQKIVVLYFLRGFL